MGEALSPCPFPLRWPPALAARSASVLIRINEFLFCIRTIVTPTPYNLTLQKLHQNRPFTINDYLIHKYICNVLK